MDTLKRFIPMLLLLLIWVGWFLLFKMNNQEVVYINNGNQETSKDSVWSDYVKPSPNTAIPQEKISIPKNIINRVIRTLTPPQNVTIISETEYVKGEFPWVKIRAWNTEWWVDYNVAFTETFDIQYEKKVVNNINMRSTRSKNGNLVKLINEGAYVEVISTKTIDGITRYYIRHNWDIWFIHQIAFEVQNEEKTYEKIVINNINMRKSESESGDLIKLINDNSIVNIISSRYKNWSTRYYIEHNWDKGYINIIAFQKQEEETLDTWFRNSQWGITDCWPWGTRMQSSESCYCDIWFKRHENWKCYTQDCWPWGTRMQSSKSCYCDIWYRKLEDWKCY